MLCHFSGLRQLITFKPLILGQVTKGQSDDIINEQIKEFESIMESFFGNQSRPEREFRDESRSRIMKVNTIEQFYILQFLQENFFFDELGITLVDRNRVQIQDCTGATAYITYYKKTGIVEME